VNLRKILNFKTAWAEAHPTLVFIRVHLWLIILCFFMFAKSV